MIGYSLQIEENETVKIDGILYFESTESHSKTIIKTDLFYVYVPVPPTRFIFVPSILGTNQTQPRNMMFLFIFHFFSQENY